MPDKEVRYKFVQHWPKPEVSENKKSTKGKRNKRKESITRLPNIPRISTRESAESLSNGKHSKTYRTSSPDAKRSKADEKEDEVTIEEYHLPPMLLPSVHESKPMDLKEIKKRNSHNTLPSLHPFHFDAKARRLRLKTEMKALRNTNDAQKKFM